MLSDGAFIFAVAFVGLFLVSLIAYGMWSWGYSLGVHDGHANGYVDGFFAGEEAEHERRQFEINDLESWIREE